MPWRQGKGGNKDFKMGLVGRKKKEVTGSGSCSQQGDITHS